LTSPTSRTTASEIDPNLLRFGVVPFVLVRLSGLLCDMASAFLLPVAVFVATGTATLAGVAFVVQWAPRVLLTPLLGVFVDRFAARSQFLVADIGRAGVLAVLAWSPTPGALIASSAALTLLNGHASLLVESVLAHGVRRADMGRAQSLQQFSLQAATVTGPAIGGWALEWADLTPTLATVAVFFGLTAVGTTAVLRGVGRGRATERVPPGEVRRLARGMRALIANHRLGVLMLVTVVVNLVGGLALAALPVVVIETFDRSAGAVGTLAGAAALLSLVAAATVSALARRSDVGRLVVPAFVLLAGSAALMVVAPALVAFGIGYGLWSAGITVFMVWMRTRRLELIDPEDVGVTLGLFVAAILAAIPVAGLLLALFGDAVAPQTLILGTAIFSAVVLVWLLRAWRATCPAPLPIGETPR